MRIKDQAHSWFGLAVVGVFKCPFSSFLRNSDNHKYYNALASFTAVETEAYRGLSDCLRPVPGHKSRLLFLSGGETCPILLLSRACHEDLIHSFT